MSGLRKVAWARQGNVEVTKAAQQKAAARVEMRGLERVARKSGPADAPMRCMDIPPEPRVQDKGGARGRSWDFGGSAEIPGKRNKSGGNQGESGGAPLNCIL